jgi:peptide/nickel transport system substrate-binding protein
LVRVAGIIKENWVELGARVEVRVFEIADLSQNVIRPRKYDTLLFGEVVGRDPDPFAFWHSSQRNDPGLNIALYTSRKVDKILEEARSSISPAIRKEKYEEFQGEIAQDVPAIFLYSPYYIYFIPKALEGFDTRHIVIPAERFTNISKWHFETKYVWKIFQ